MTYTANVGGAAAVWLASDEGPLLGTGQDISNEGGGVITFDDAALAALRGLTDDTDGLVDEEPRSSALRMWIGGNPYPVTEG